jgi:hypothetical protein
VGLGSYPKAKSEYDHDSLEYHLNAHVNIGTQGSGCATGITGKDVEIYAGVNKLYLSSYSYAKTTGLHGRAWAYSYVDEYEYRRYGIDSKPERIRRLQCQGHATQLIGGTCVYCYAGKK